MVNSPASEFHMPTFRNTPSVPSSQAGRCFGHSSHLRAYDNGRECSETSAYTIQTPGNYPEGSTQHSEQEESLKLSIST